MKGKCLKMCLYEKSYACNSKVFAENIKKILNLQIWILYSYCIPNILRNFKWIKWISNDTIYSYVKLSNRRWFGINHWKSAIYAHETEHIFETNNYDIITQYFEHIMFYVNLKKSKYTMSFFLRNKFSFENIHP